MNTINPRKLLNSKWTTATPEQQEKHFVVVQVLFDDDNRRVEDCVIEAVHTRRRRHIDWRELMDDSRWRFGWR